MSERIEILENEKIAMIDANLKQKEKIESLESDIYAMNEDNRALK